MKNGGAARLGAILLILIVAVVAVGGIYLLGRSIFGGGSGEVDNEGQAAAQQLLDEPTAETEVRMTVRGPVVAAEVRYSIAVIVRQDSREMVSFRGYEGEVIRDVKLDNTAASFRELTAALNQAGMMNSNGQVNDNRGICAGGQLISFTVRRGEETVGELWVSSCEDDGRNFVGNFAGVTGLFLDQIPGSRTIVDEAKAIGQAD